jgi:hypothetical protein
MDDLRAQFAAETESEAVGRMRYYAAGLSMLFGIFSLGGFLSMALGDLSWAAAPGSLLMLVGGPLGVLAQRTVHVPSSRRFGMWAAICTAAGFVEFFFASLLTAGT